MEVRIILDRLDRWLRKHRPGMLHALRPGATAEEVDGLQTRVGIALPASLRTLLAWHNGQSEDRLGGFEQDWQLMSTSQIENTYRELLKQQSETGPSWQPPWLPVFEDGNGDYLFVDTSTSSAPLRACWAGQAEQPTLGPSLEAWLEDFVNAVEKGQYYEEAERGTFIRKH